jgi:hypothetical protein
LTSDSLNETVIVIVLVLTISNSGELLLVDEEEVDEPEPRLPDVVAPALADAPVLPELEVVELPVAAPVLCAVTLSPGDRLATEAIVPLIGA